MDRPAAQSPIEHPDMDYQEHERTYHSFVTGTKYASVAILLILILVYYWTS